MKRQLTSGLFVAVLSTILACPSASRAVPSGRQLYTKVQQQVKGRARKELNKRLYKMHGIKFVDISQNGSHGDLNTSGRFAVNADAKVIEPSKLTEAQRRHIAANPQEIWVRTTATINLGGELSLPLGHLTLRPKAGTRIAVVKETTVNASGINSIVNRDGSLSEVFDSQVQMAKQAAARLKPITSLEDVKKHLPENGTVTLLVQGHVGMTASGGVSYRGDNSLGRLGMNLGVSVSAKNEGFYEVTLTRRSGNEAYVVVRKAKTSTVALALGLNARATVDFREALPAVSNSYLDKAVEKGEAKVRKNLQKYADHLHTRASLNLSDRQAFESTKAMTIDLDDNRVYQAEQRLRLRDATFDLGVKVGSITVAKRLSKGTAKQDTLTLDDGSRISYKRETIRGEQEGLLSSSSLFGFSEGARKAKEERITVVGRNGESLTYLAGEYSTQDNKTTSTERKRFRDVARLFGFSNQRPLGTSKASTRSMRYEIDDAGYRKLASYVSRGRLTEAGEIAIGQAIDAVAQRAFGSRGRLPFADPRLTKAQRAELMAVAERIDDVSSLTDYDSSTPQSEYRSLTRRYLGSSRNLNQDVKYFKQLKRVKALVERLGGAADPNKAALEGADMPLNDFIMRAAVLAQVVGLQNVNVTMKTVNADGKVAFELNHRARTMKRINPESLAAKVLHDPKIVDIDG